ncbi:sialidase family protein [Maridesulfovibrio sp.]|uniref:sialidase family protein n=1 Tax=Maridesulfovibrio sp. TaxID=2795000 RepID=UPI002AA7C3DF|nr:sialidase family protein [Maridesulfovibrio sp.]
MTSKQTRLSLSILDTKRITPPEWEGYQSFPTITNVDGELLVGFRRAVNISNDLRQVMDHGMAGDIYTTRSKDGGYTFEPPQLIISHAQERTNEHDALLTHLGNNKVLLISRTHTSDLRRNYYSLSTDGGRSFPKRQTLDLYGYEWASFGHFIPALDDTNTFIGTFYNGPGCGTFRFNPENGETSRQSYIYKSIPEYRLNETSITRLPSGRILALIRQQPCLDGLFKSHSDDDGKTWSTPQPIGLYGEAPSITLLPDGRILCLYRGMIRKNPKCRVALSISEDSGQTWSRPQTLAWYKGGRFHGGYGDLEVNHRGQIVAVYYISRKQEAPVVERMMLELE